MVQVISGHPQSRFHMVAHQVVNKICRDKDIIFSEKKELIPSEIYPVLLSCSIGILSFKYLMGSLNKKDYTPIDLKGSIVDYKTFFDDIYGG